MPDPAQQLSADDRMRALQQLQRIVSAVAAEHPALSCGNGESAAQDVSERQSGKKRTREHNSDDDPVDEERVAVWNQLTGKKLTGQAAPKRKCALPPPRTAA